MNVAIRLGLEQIDYVSNMGEFDALLNEQKSAMDAEDWEYVAERFTSTGQVAGLEMIQTRYGYDAGLSFDQLLMDALTQGQVTDTVTADGRQVPLVRHVQRLLEAGANADRIPNAEELALTVKKNSEHILGLLRSNPAYSARPPAVPPTPATGQAESVNTSALDRAITTLRQSSGQDWKHHDESGRVYLEVKGMNSVTEASNALFRHGVPLNYGGKNIIDDKTAVVIPDNVLEQVPDSLLRNAGQAVGLALRETAAEEAKAKAQPRAVAPASPASPAQKEKQEGASPPSSHPVKKRRQHAAHKGHTHAHPHTHPHHPSTGSSPRRLHRPHSPHPSPHEPKP